MRLELDQAYVKYEKLIPNKKKTKSQLSDFKKDVWWVKTKIKIDTNWLQFKKDLSTPIPTVKPNMKVEIPGMISGIIPGSIKTDKTAWIWKLGNFQWKNISEELKKRIKELGWKTITMIWLYIFLVWVLYYWYSNGQHKKALKVSVYRENVKILNENIKKQKDELKALKNLKFNSTDLEDKEKIVEKHLPMFDNNLYFEQMYRLHQIANHAWLEIGAIQKLEEIRTDELVNELWEELLLQDINNFYEDAWYVRYALDVAGKENTIFTFIELLEERVEFVIDTFTIVKWTTEIRYNISIKAFYNLKR